jgi:hypothetical protein
MEKIQLKVSPAQRDAILAGLRWLQFSMTSESVPPPQVQAIWAGIGTEVLMPMPSTCCVQTW